ncbi:MAG: hypothetical protein AAF438_12570 [Pseudomonadota bacterium]
MKSLVFTNENDYHLRMGILTVDRERYALSLHGDDSVFRRSWTGALARHMLESGIVPTGCCKSGRYRCDKTLAWHLILAATAAEVAISQ